MSLKKWSSTDLWSAFMDDYNTNIDELNEEITSGLYDTGWITADLTLSNLFKAYADIPVNVPEYRKIGSVVHIRGVVTPANDITYSITSYTIFTLPEGFRPNKSLTFVCQGSGITRWLLTVASDGRVAFSRYGDGTGKTASAGPVEYAWLPFTATYFIDKNTL